MQRKNHLRALNISTKISFELWQETKTEPFDSIRDVYVFHKTPLLQKPCSRALTCYNSTFPSSKYNVLRLTLATTGTVNIDDVSTQPNESTFSTGVSVLLPHLLCIRDHHTTDLIVTALKVCSDGRHCRSAWYQSDKNRVKQMSSYKHRHHPPISERCCA